jgi:hypothetical protein
MFIQKPFALTTTTGGDTPGYTVDDSIWVQTSDSPEIIMPNSDGGGLKWIMSVWFKLGSLDTSGSGDSNRYTLVSVLDGSSNGTIVEISSSGESMQDQLYWEEKVGTTAQRCTERLFRDPTGWYHLVLFYDSANANEDARMNMWINGVFQSEWNSSEYTNPGASQKSKWGGSTENVDIFNQANARYWDGYVSQFAYIYGQDYTADNFGEFDTNGVWRPKDLTDLDFSGAKSFWLDFADSSDLDKDVSGEGNNGTGTTGIASTNQVVDTPSG